MATLSIGRPAWIAATVPTWRRVLGAALRPPAVHRLHRRRTKVMASAAPNLTPVTLELGGKSPAVVTPGYPLAHAASASWWASCSTPARPASRPTTCCAAKAQLEPFVAARSEAARRAYPGGLVVVALLQRHQRPPLPAPAGRLDRRGRGRRARAGAAVRRPGARRRPPPPGAAADRRRRPTAADARGDLRPAAAGAALRHGARGDGRINAAAATAGAVLVRPRRARTDDALRRPRRRRLRQRHPAARGAGRACPSAAWAPRAWATTTAAGASTPSASSSPCSASRAQRHGSCSCRRTRR
jgi:hypothetical protein